MDVPCPSVGELCGRTVDCLLPGFGRAIIQRGCTVDMEVELYCMGDCDETAVRTTTDAVNVIVIGTGGQEHDACAVSKHSDRFSLRTSEIDEDSATTVVYDVYPGLGLRSWRRRRRLGDLNGDHITPGTTAKRVGSLHAVVVGPNVSTGDRC